MPARPTCNVPVTNIFHVKDSADGGQLVEVLALSVERFTARPACLQVGVEGKRFRPAIVLLMASSLSTNGAPEPAQLTVDERPPNVTVLELRRRQQRLAEITDLIHVASLLHDDVIDDAETRRSLPALNMVQGNKVAILAGELQAGLPVACVLLARQHAMRSCTWVAACESRTVCSHKDWGAGVKHSIIALACCR